ncbi:hypothetical protein EDD15DRAFT_2116555, partial [Pisolithus albus]
SRKLRKWAKAYINDRSMLPFRQNRHMVSAIDDETVVEELSLHLRSIGKFACARDIVDFLAVPENRERLKIHQPISVRTAHRWMKRMGWKWKQEAKGQYVDGHEREDVVTYRQNVFLP